MPLRYTGNCKNTENEAMLQIEYWTLQECWRLSQESAIRTFGLSKALERIREFKIILSVLLCG